LRHVIRAEKGKGSAKEAEAEGICQDQDMSERPVPVEGGFEDGADFIDFGQGSPGAISSEETEGESGESEGSEEDEGDESGSANNEVDSVRGKQRAFTSPPFQSSQASTSDIPMGTDEADEEEVLGVVS